MKTVYLPSNDQFAINGITAMQIDDEGAKALSKKVKFLDESSKEVQAYKSEVAKRQAEALVKAEAAQALDDEREALDKIVKEKFAEELALRVKEKQAKRRAEAKSAKAK
jgi:hypothetical protein